MKKILVVLLIAASLFALVSCSDKDTAEVFVAGGKIHVNFDHNQKVSEKYMQFGDDKVVSYRVCDSADVTIQGLEFVEAVDAHINGLTLVAVDNKTKKDFVVAFTFDGALLDSIGKIFEDVMDMLPDKLIITNGKFTIPAAILTSFVGGNTTTTETEEETTTTTGIEGNLIEFEIPNFTITNLSVDGTLTLAPVYLTEDVLGLASDWLSGNAFKGIAPLTVLNVTYRNGENACSTVLSKLDPNVTFVLDTTDTNGKTVNATNLVEGANYYVNLNGEDRFVTINTDNPTVVLNYVVTGDCDAKGVLNYSSTSTKKAIDYIIAKQEGVVSGFWTI